MQSMSHLLHLILRKASSGSHYIMTFIDLLTGRPKSFCMKDSMGSVGCFHPSNGNCLSLWSGGKVHSNRGVTFLSHLFKTVTSCIGSRQTFTSGRSPTGNARVERMHKMLKNVITTYINDEHDTWPQLVPIPLWSI